MNAEHYARLLREAEASKKSIAALRTDIGIKDLEFAYSIQKINTDLKLESGAVPTGKKIGLTSFAVQEQLGVDQPDFGVLFKEMELENGSKVSFSELMQPKIEGEIAFVLKADLTKEKATLEEVKAAVDYCLPALEIVGSRIENWNIRITDTIADNASASHYVLGTEGVSLHSLDLENCKMALYKNGELASEGSGKACMDSPLNAMLWLANKMVEIGSPLKAGEVVLSGALGPMVAVNAGDEFKLQIGGFSPCAIKIAM